MLNDNKRCILCDKTYKFCEGCPSKYNVKETWRNIFCSEECREIYHVYDLLKSGKATEKEAHKMLKKYDVSLVNRTLEPMKSVLLVSYNYNEPAKKVEKITPVETKVDAEVVEKKEVTPAPKKKGRKKKSIEVN